MTDTPRIPSPPGDPRPSAGSVAAALPAVLLGGLRAAAARPGVVVLLLLVNLLAALVLAVPVQTLLSAELDDNLHGERMEDGASWRWFHTVEREHPQAVGSYAAWAALLEDEGVTREDLAQLSGPPAALALAGLVFLLLSAVLHTGYLGALARRDDGGSGGAATLLTEAVRHAPGALLLGALAALAYGGWYALAFSLTHRPLAELAEALQSERWHLALVGLRLGVTLLGFLLLKVLFDLAKVGLVERGPWSVGGALATAGRELRHRGWAYLLLYVVLGAATVGLAVLWWVLSGPLVPETWLGFLILFVLHQIFLALRIGLRLTHLGTARALHRRATAVV